MQLTKVSGPQWLGTNFENSYPYLFNSLLLVKNQAPAMIEHPGTVTQVFGATVLSTSGKGSKRRLSIRKRSSAKSPIDANLHRAGRLSASRVFGRLLRLEPGTR